MGDGRVGLVEDVEGLCLHIVHSTSSTPDPEISHSLTEEELEDLAMSDCRPFEGFMQSYSTSFSWFTGTRIFTGRRRPSGKRRYVFQFCGDFTTDFTTCSYEVFLFTQVLLMEKTDELTTWDENERKRLPTLNYLLDEILYYATADAMFTSGWWLYSLSKPGVCGRCAFHAETPARCWWAFPAHCALHQQYSRSRHLTPGHQWIWPFHERLFQDFLVVYRYYQFVSLEINWVKIPVNHQRSDLWTCRWDLVDFTFFWFHHSKHWCQQPSGERRPSGKRSYEFFQFCGDFTTDSTTFSCLW